jgi:hypothetical protein
MLRISIHVYMLIRDRNRYRYSTIQLLNENEISIHYNHKCAQTLLAG